MPRYRLTQTAEAAGRDAAGKHAEPVVYWVEDYCSLDWYDAPARVQEHDPSKARHIATLERLT